MISVVPDSGPPLVTFTMTREDAELAINALARLPYAQVYGLINKLQFQGENQKLEEPESV